MRPMRLILFDQISTFHCMSAFSRWSLVQQEIVDVLDSLRHVRVRARLIPLIPPSALILAQYPSPCVPIPAAVLLLEAVPLGR
jgi:hypothetical protein